MVPIYTFNIVSTNVDTAPTLHEAHWRQMIQGTKNQQPKNHCSHSNGIYSLSK